MIESVSAALLIHLSNAVSKWWLPVSITPRPAIPTPLISWQLVTLSTRGIQPSYTLCKLAAFFFLFAWCIISSCFIRNKNVPLRLIVRGLDYMFLFTLFILRCLLNDIETWQILWQTGGKEWNLQTFKCWNHTNCRQSDESQPLSKVFQDVGGTVESWCLIWDSWVLTVSLARLIGNVQKNRVDQKNKRPTQFQCDIGILWGNLHFGKKDCVRVSKRTLCVIFFLCKGT